MTYTEQQATELTVLNSPPELKSHKDTENLALGFLGGCVGGLANVFVGHPFDTLKVRMQMHRTKLIPCIKSMIKNEGPASLYKGITSPLYNVPIIYSLCFGSYEVGLWALGARFHKEPTVLESVAAGAWAGLVISFALTPMELVKCRLQMEGVGQRVQKTKAWQMTKTLAQTYGIRELYKANTLTILREVPSNAAYFGVYVYLKNALKPILGDGALNIITVGGLSGLASWIVAYPQDTVKTRVQCDTLGTYKRSKYFNDNGIIDCGRKIWQQEGMRGFWKGFSACSIRATFSEAVTFFVYDRFRKQFIY